MRILAMSGFIPEYICDVVRFTDYSGERNIPHYCGYASDFISQVLQDQSIDGAVYPKSCDSSRILSSYLSESQKFVYQLDIPSNGIIGAVEYYADQIQSYKTAIEKYYNVSLDDLPERIDRINNRNRELALIYDELYKYDYYEYLKSIHELLQKPLSEQNVIIPTGGNTFDKKVFVIGSFLSNLDIVKMIENVGMKVVGDTFPESGRLASRPVVEKNGDIFINISSSIMRQRLSPTQNDFNNMLDLDIREMKEKEVEGVIFVTQQYCEPYDYYYSVAKDIIEKQGIKVLKITLSGSDDRKALISLEAFADKL